MTDLAVLAGAGRAPADGLEPSLRPATEREPGLARDLRAVKAAAAAGPVSAVLAAGGGGLAERILRKRVVNANGAMASMLRSVAHHETAARSYNALAVSKDPGLFADIARLAGESGATGPQMVRRVLDRSDADPAVAALRPRMEALSRDPEMEALTRQMHEIARRFEDRADIVCRMIDRIDGGRPAPGAMAAVQRLGDLVGKELGARVAAMPALAAGAPAAVDASSGARMAASAGALQARGSAMQSRFNAALGAAMRRG